MNTQRVVITGIGAVSPHGIGKQALWDSAVNGNSSVRTIEIGDHGTAVKIHAGQVSGFDANTYLPQKIIKQTDRSTHMAMAACRLAMEDASLDLTSISASDVGMYFSTLFGGMDFAEPELYAQAHIGPDRVSAYQAIAWFYAATQGQWSILSQSKGYSKTVVADRAGGLHALSWAALAIQQGHCKVMFAGGFDAPLVPYTMAIHKTSGLLSDSQCAPGEAYRPFDVGRRGMVLGEGAGVLILEELNHALSRGADIYAEITGFGCCSDATSTLHNARLSDCIRQVLGRAGIGPENIDHVMAEGVATAADDEIEASALRSVFGQHQPTVSVPKSTTGHMLSAAGPIDCAWACLMMKHNFLLPTSTLATVAPECALNHVLHGRPASTLDHVLCVARGHGGTNAALTMKRFSAN